MVFRYGQSLSFSAIVLVPHVRVASAGRLSIKVSVTFGVSDTFKVAVFPASTVKEYTVVSTLYPNGAERSFI